MEIMPTSPAVGAEILGVDLRSIDDDEFATIHQAFVDHGVIFFRDQDLTPADHVAFAERWGQINVNRFFTPVEGHPQVAEVRKEPDQVKNIGGAWHTDHSYDQIPALGSILFARETPPLGGDTMFASQYAAYDALSPALQDMLLDLWADHSSRHIFGVERGLFNNTEAATQDAVHPVVVKHPMSGRPALYVNLAFTLRFHGWTDQESAPLLNYLYEHAARPEFTTRFEWRPGSMAIWDNRAVQHNALNDYHGHRRLMHRITIEGAEVGPAREQPRPERTAA
jgi:taurine dioxygenase